MDYLSLNTITLVSIINTKLRDFYPDLASLVEDLDINLDELNKKMNQDNFYYDIKTNQFIKR